MVTQGLCRGVGGARNMLCASRICLTPWGGVVGAALSQMVKWSTGTAEPDTVRGGVRRAVAHGSGDVGGGARTASAGTRAAARQYPAEAQALDGVGGALLGPFANLRGLMFGFEVASLFRIGL